MGNMEKSDQVGDEPEMIELHYILFDCERCKEARKPKEPMK